MTATTLQFAVPMDKLVPSKTNPRKHFNKEALAELTENVKKHGILQPVLVRSIAQGFELVAGERRYRAAKAAGLVEIPANVRELSDVEVLEFQIIENLQREDLLPLEEAEGYERLLKFTANGHKYTADDIALKVGKSRGYVYGKIKLLALCPEGRKALEDGKLSEYTAQAIARVPTHDLQRQALKEIITPRYHGGAPLTHREAVEHLQRIYMLRLADAPFKADDATLVPKAGTCGACPKRTGNQPELFGDVKNADVCTDPPCFQSKVQALMARTRAEAEATGRKVISGKEALAIKPYEHGAMGGGYVPLKDKCYEDPKGRTYSQLLGKEAKPELLQDPHDKVGSLVEIIKPGDYKTILKEKGAIRAPASRSNTNAKAREKSDTEREVRKRVFLALCPKLPAALGKEELSWLAHGQLYNAGDGLDLVISALLPTKDGKPPKDEWKHVENAIPQLDAAGLSKLVVALELAGHAERVHYTNKDDDQLLATAKRWKVDVDAIRKNLSTETKAKVAEKKPAKQSPKKK